MVKVKICGITNEEDALLAVELGAHAIGFVFAESPRKISPVLAQEISNNLPSGVEKVGVFVDEEKDTVYKIASLCNLDILQLHGRESPSYCESFELKIVKAIRAMDYSVLELLSQYKVDAFLLDAYVPNVPGGTGKTFDWGIARRAKDFGRIILSGGLNPDNVGKAIEKVEPYGVDVSSGVEVMPGKKDPEKLRAFFDAVYASGHSKNK